MKHLGWLALAVALATGTAFFATLSTAGFDAHGTYIRYERDILSLLVLSNGAIGLAYVAISTMLGVLVWKLRRALPFDAAFLWFAAFILTCGATHFTDILVLWIPAYWIEGYVLLVCATASVATALALPRWISRAIALVEDARLSDLRQSQIEKLTEIAAADTNQIRRLTAELDAQVRGAGGT